MHRLIAWLIRRDIERGPIVEICSQLGGLVYAPREILAEFVRHYSALYASEDSPGDNLCAAFVSEVELACLGEEQAEAIEAPLDLEEIKASIREFASGRVTSRLLQSLCVAVGTQAASRIRRRQTEGSLTSHSGRGDAGLSS
ncbi:hypothetical protein NDU88_004321 [Pleurodeles waltl]|uniref:Uncharacterized protein n=1 Tax=Pleurodeles waltl TaxID=8319 RepID=A0AAV7LJK7_PLEWA|nr:hypothetical protein NDU88_004321 [Pleurodeles waltl]